MRILVWLFRAFLFFVLFAFALNNQHEARVRWFFGHEWHAPMVFVVLIAFAAGCAAGVFAMVPSWWRHRRDAGQRRHDAVDATPVDAAAAPSTISDAHPPRDGL